MTEYRLDPPIARRRAAAGAAAGTVAALAPVLVGLALLARANERAGAPLLGAGAAAIAVLAALRTLLAYRRARAELGALRVEAREDALLVRTRRGTRRVPLDAVERVVEYPGWLGGLRVELADGWDGTRGAPGFLDVPRGGDGFGELRAALDRVKPIATPRRRGAAARVALGAAIVLGLFFVPFLLADLGRSPLVVLAIVVLAWAALRLVASRR